MANARTVKDLLREEYFDLLPETRRALIETETRVRAAVLQLSLRVRQYERIVITARIKECDSAIDSLERRQPLALFDPGSAYSLTDLRDLAAVRVMAFPSARFRECHEAVVGVLKNWTADPIPHVTELDTPLAFKYYGAWSSNARITSEVQVVPLLVGLFWEVEHAAIYKPSPKLRQRVIGSAAVLERRNDVLAALRAFESEFERAIHSDTSSHASAE